MNNRTKAYRRNAEKLSLKRRKFINNSVKNYEFTDEQVKVNKDHAINWWSNEWWTESIKKKRIRKIRHDLKNELNNIIKDL
ncbi:hypothetical protein IKN40_00935 [bacterium]|nr:hypothetical protein [bacterium]